ncbi:hypothetical protein NEOLEDRAFT_1059659 [Neolentinus lepideus HHB14362 ss-1]|uniref:Xylanolytic transcriptional activator regulatory domain-containing protein n=1 Tax=Neolentinus lepideus HHB14362 ss-1 TaxID=1314782 RepID=A0A165U8H8_9AGAM|nr:hypothetical protein NEOLEDRAFT_1059659 [Neolentinus lepideus HHB14362 ss-1]
MSTSRIGPDRSHGAGTSTRRRAAPLSCAECRRTRNDRCSRVFPCTSCVKKGCAAICPDGSLTTGKGNRFVLANTEILHEKIELLSNRVRQLEDALADVYREQSSHPHPLLSEELLSIKRPLEREETEPAAPRERPEEAAEVIDAFGSLSIGQSGRSTFFGQTANSWNEEETEGDEEVGTPTTPLPADVRWLSNIFPFAMHFGQHPAEVRDSILSLLPAPDRAQQLLTLYYKHAAWMYTPIYETDFIDNVYIKFYNDISLPEFAPVEMHRLAVLYMVFAMGALLDLDRPPLCLEANQYYSLGRAALSIGSVLEEPSIQSIQALIIMSHYMFLANIDSPRWAIMGLVMKFVQTVNRDSGKWQLSPEETMQRRSLMWEVYTYDSWQASSCGLTFGRPPSFSMSQIDCQMAFETTQNERGEVEMSFAAWKHRFTSQCLSVVHEQAFGARGVSYPTLQKLDQAVRKFYTPPSLVVPGFGSAADNADREPASLELTMQRHIALAIREITIFYMHRGFFARALEDQSGDPLSSKYSPSVLACYNSACSFVGLIKNLFSQQPELTQRMWFLFTHVFSCAIALGAIPSKSPGMALAPSALAHLKSAHHLFEQISLNPRAIKVLPVLRKLDARASAAMADHRSAISPDSPTRRTSYGEPVIKSEEDEWATLGGKTRLVSRRSPTSGGSSGSRSPETVFAVSPYSPTSPSTAASPSTATFRTASPPPQASVQETQYAPGWDVYPAQEQMAYDPNSAVPQGAWGFWGPDGSWQMAQGAVDAGEVQQYQGQYMDYSNPEYQKAYYAQQQQQGAQQQVPYETDVTDSWRHFFAQFNQV